jgi:hypothetical protein
MIDAPGAFVLIFSQRRSCTWLNQAVVAHAARCPALFDIEVQITALAGVLVRRDVA